MKRHPCCHADWFRRCAGQGELFGAENRRYRDDRASAGEQPGCARRGGQTPRNQRRRRATRPSTRIATDGDQAVAELARGLATASGRGDRARRRARSRPGHRTGDELKAVEKPTEAVAVGVVPGAGKQLHHDHVGAEKFQPSLPAPPRRAADALGLPVALRNSTQTEVSTRIIAPGISSAAGESQSRSPAQPEALGREQLGAGHRLADEDAGGRGRLPRACCAGGSDASPCRPARWSISMFVRVIAPLYTFRWYGLRGLLPWRRSCDQPHFEARQGEAPAPPSRARIRLT